MGRWNGFRWVDGLAPGDRCEDGSIMRHAPSHDDPYGEVCVGLCTECGGVGCDVAEARAEAAEAKLATARGALAWYEYAVRNGCMVTQEGRGRIALDRDGGKRAADALRAIAGEGEAG